MKKLAGYSADQSIDPQLRQLYQALSPSAAQFPEVAKVLKKIDQALSLWYNGQTSGDPNEIQKGRGAATEAINRGRQLLTDIQRPKAPGENLTGYLQQTSQQGQNWGVLGKQGQNLAERVVLAPASQLNGGQPGPDNWINIKGVPLHPTQFGTKQIQKNPHADMVEQHMGSWMSYTDNGREQNIWIRGTQESWNKFLSVAGWIFKNDASLRSFKFPTPLPSEKQFNPAYTDSVVQKKRKGDQAKPLSASVIQGSVDASGKRAAMTGIRLQFDIKEPSFRTDFPTIVDFCYEAVPPAGGKGGGAGQSPAKTRVYWDQGIIDLFDVAKDKDAALKLNRLKQNLRANFYDITSFSAAIQQVTGFSQDQAYEDRRYEEQNAVLTQRQTTNALNANLYDGGARVATRFQNILQEIGVQPGQALNDQQYQQVVAKAYAGKGLRVDKNGKPVGPFGPNNWGGPFGPGTSPEQRANQAQGMKFLSERVTGVIADQPGSGKTAQSIIAADIVREEGQKVLVITPNSLLKENWAGRQAKGPMFFCGHDPSQVAVCDSAEQVEAAMANPTVAWVVCKKSNFQRANQQGQDYAMAINRHAKAGKFASMLIDEIQQFKDVDSISFNNLNLAIGGNSIPNRMGLTGTPSDNTPKDMFIQLALLRHKLLFKRDEAPQVKQGVEGFANQFLGGPALSEGVMLSAAEKKANPTEDAQEELKQRKWQAKAHSVLQWAANLDDSRKEQILDLFSNTYLRREKEDIEPNLRKVAPVNGGIDPATGKPRIPEPIQVPIDPEVAAATKEGKGWHTAVMKQAAFKKAPHTAAKIIEILKSKPRTKVFVGTQYVECTRMIADIINAQFPGGAAAMNAQDAKSLEQRSKTADSFRDENSPLRCVVYTAGIGAVGLNFNNAEYAILNDLSWNPSINEQMFDRIDRIDTKHPINKHIMTMPGSFDEEMYKRINAKREINKQLTRLMREARNPLDPKQKVAVANEFVKDTLKNVLLDVGLTPERLEWFNDNLDKALGGGGATIETPEQREELNIRNREKRPVDALNPEYFKEIDPDPNRAAMDRSNHREWQQRTEGLLNKLFGEGGWQNLRPEQWQDALDKYESERIERIKQEKAWLAAFMTRLNIKVG